MTLWLNNIIGADDQQCRRLEVWDMVRVVSLEQCDFPCAVEFERCWEYRFVVRGFVPWQTRDIAWEGDIDVVFWSEHDEYVSGGFVMIEDSRSVSSRFLVLI